MVNNNNNNNNNRGVVGRLRNVWAHKGDSEQKEVALKSRSPEALM